MQFLEMTKSLPWEAWSALGTWLGALATLVATCVALYLGLSPIRTERLRRRDQATVLRSQLCIQLEVIGRLMESINSQTFHMPDWNRNLEQRLEPLKTLWAQAHVLEPEEYKALGRLMTEAVPVLEAGGPLPLLSGEVERLSDFVRQAKDALHCPVRGESD